MLALMTVIVLGAGALAVLPAVAETNNAIPWMDDYASTLRKAQEANRLVMIEFWTSWCQFCGKLEKETLEDPRIVGLAGEFVCARLDADVQTVAQSRYRPEGYPTVVFATSTGEEIVRISGFRPADPFYLVMKAVIERGPEMSRHFERLEEDPRNLEATLSLGVSYLDLGIVDRATDYLTRALKLARSSNPAPHGEDAEANISFLLGRAEREQQNFRKASRILEQLIATRPADDDLPRYYLELERVYDDWGKDNQVTKLREEGASSFDSFCSGCHGTGAKGSDTAPPLVEAANRWSMAQLAAYIVDPASFRAKDPRLQELDARYPEIQMPPIDVPDDRRRALVVWLLTSFQQGEQAGR